MPCRVLAIVELENQIAKPLEIYSVQLVLQFLRVYPRKRAHYPKRLDNLPERARALIYDEPDV